MAEARSKIESRQLALALAVALMAAAPARGQQQSGAAATAEAGQQRRVVVSIPLRKLVLIAGERVVRTYDVAVGAEQSPSPTGEFRIVNRIVRPTYYRPGRVVPAGRANPLGTRWLGLDRKSYGIHGTNEPDSIGQAASHGCVRMRNEAVEELFELLREGDVVQIVSEHDQQVATLFDNAPSMAVPAGAAGGGD